MALGKPQPSEILEPPLQLRALHPGWLPGRFPLEPGATIPAAGTAAPGGSGKQQGLSTPWLQGPEGALPSRLSVTSQGNTFGFLLSVTASTAANMIKNI